MHQKITTIYKKVLFWLKNPKAALEDSFIRYLIIGFTTFGLDFGIFDLLIRFTDIAEVPANLISVLVSLIFNFTMSNFWTFRVGKRDKFKKISRYALLATFNYFFNNSVFTILVTYIKIPGFFAKVIVTAAVVTWNFFIYKFWIFKKNESA